MVKGNAEYDKNEAKVKYVYVTPAHYSLHPVLNSSKIYLVSLLVHC
jgi:hypothetical protein